MKLAKFFDERTALLFHKNEIAIKRSPDSSHPLSLPTGRELLDVGLKDELKNICWINESSLDTGPQTICAEVQAPMKLPVPWVWKNLREIARLSQDYPAFQAIGRAFQIIQWDKNHQYCGRCGSPTQKKENEKSRVCESCRLSFFPRISPSAIVIVKRDDEILLARSPHFAPGVYSAIAGFVEAGETVEQAAEREVREEVGIQIKNLHYQFSQPWPFPDSLMLGYTADYQSGEIAIDGVEIEDARWFTRDRLPDLPMRLSIARALINKVLNL